MEHAHIIYSNVYFWMHFLSEVFEVEFVHESQISYVCLMALNNIIMYICQSDVDIDWKFGTRTPVSLLDK